MVNTQFKGHTAELPLVVCKL